MNTLPTQGDRVRFRNGDQEVDGTVKNGPATETETEDGTVYLSVWAPTLDNTLFVHETNLVPAAAPDHERRETDDEH